MRRDTFIKSACIIYTNPFGEREKRGGLACHSRDARTNPRETPRGSDGNSYNYVVELENGSLFADCIVRGEKEDET